MSSLSYTYPDLEDNKEREAEGEEWAVGSMTSRIDNLRKPVTPDVIRKTAVRFDAICSIKKPDELKAEILKFFPDNKHQIIREFFLKHPVCWHDLKRKLYAITTYDDISKKWHISEDKIWDIYSIFLIRGRAHDIGEQIRKLLPSVISENQSLLGYCGKQTSLLDANLTIQPSLLDEGGYIFNCISENNRKSYIRKLLTNGMIQNIDKCTYKEALELAPNIFPKLLNYLKEIFWKTIHIFPNQYKTFDSIVDTLDTMLWSSRWIERETAFRIIQSFHAWSSLEDIEKYHELANEKIKHLPAKLRKAGIIINTDIGATEHNDATIYSAQISFKGKEYRAEWRVKSVRSILQKMWETEEYTNKDAIRDMIGVSFIFPDGTPLDEKQELMITAWALMPNFWYILRAKWEFWGIISDVAQWLNRRKKNPALVSFKLWDTSHSDFNNAIQSGFISFDWESIWTEFQYLEESDAKWKKEDDKIYKPKWIIAVLMRWPKFSTPRDCFDILNNRIDEERIRELKFDTINAIIISYINDGFLIPYVSQSGKELLLTCKGKEKAFEKKFPTMEQCWPNHSRYNNALKYITGLQ